MSINDLVLITLAMNRNVYYLPDGRIGVEKAGIFDEREFRAWVEAQMRRIKEERIVKRVDWLSSIKAETRAL